MAIRIYKCTNCYRDKPCIFITDEEDRIPCACLYSRAYVIAANWIEH